MIANPVIDPARLFDAAQTARLEAAVRRVRADTGIDLVVLTTRGLNGEHFTEFADRFHAGWYRMSQRRQTALILFAPRDGLVAVSTADAAGPITDAERQAIIDAMIVRAADGRFEDAAMVGIDGIAQIFAPQALAA